MPIPRLHPADTTLVVVDVQEALLPTLVGAERLLTNCAAMLRIAGALRLPALVTEQYPQGLGRTVACVLEAAPAGTPVIEKTHFSAAVDELTRALHRSRRGSVLICGIEAHICVLQTVLDLQANGWQCFVASDAVTAGQADQIGHAFERMKRAGAIITGVLSSTYEMLGDSGHPAFRACLEQVKKVDRGADGRVARV